MLSQLPAFLVEAKRTTYALLADRASAAPALSGSKQLEYRSGRLAYCDIHFGLARFAGQETVRLGQHPVWSMVYAGGVAAGVVDPADIALVHDCLHHALRLVDIDRPFRGPCGFALGALRYVDESEGAVGSFRGTERILRNGALVYRLDYGGGLIR